MRPVLFFIQLLVFPTVMFGQLASSPPLGPRALGMGNNGVTLEDPWSIFNNPAGITGIDKTSTLFAYRTIFDFTPFNTVSAGAVMPSKFGTVALSVFRFGDDLFSSQMTSAMIGKKIQLLNLGLRLNHLQFNIDGFGRKSILLADIGSLVRLTDELTLGAMVSNFSQSSVSQETRERIPTIIKMGVSYTSGEDLMLLMEVEKDVDLEADIKFGLEYRLIDNILVRTGITTSSRNHSFGAGFRLNKFLIDYGIRINRFLGHNHNLGISYNFSAK